MKPIQGDPLLTTLAFVLSLVGIFFIFDAGYARNLERFDTLVPREVIVQALMLVAGLFTVGLMRRVPEPTWRRAAWPLWLFALILLLLTDLVGIQQNEAKRWLGYGPVVIQPSEFAKVALVLLLAHVFADRKPWPRKPPRAVGDWLAVALVPKLKRALPAGAVVAGIALVEHGRDLGTAAVFLVVLAGMAVVGGVSRKSLLIGAVVLTAATGFLVLKQPYRMNRILTHFNRWEPQHIERSGYQTTRAELAMSDGGWFGVGLGNGVQKVDLPAPMTDYIFATIAEETGLFGTWLVLGLLAALVFRLVWLAFKVDTAFARLVLFGIAIWIGVQTCTNLLMANATVPSIGIPVPFLSAGGSSLLALWMAIGLAQAVAVRTRPLPEWMREDERDRDRRRDRGARVPGARDRPGTEAAWGASDRARIAARHGGTG